MTLSIMLLASSLQAQSERKTYTYDIKKGQVFDIIMLSNKEGVEDKLQDYFKRAFPHANAAGYHGLGGFAIKENTQGNSHPQTMVFGYWDNLPGRLEFLETIADKMPDFHKMRRDIWSTFGLTYYTFDHDVSFEIDRRKVNVVTAYWKKDGEDFESFKKEWQTKADKAGGKLIIGFTDGTSPYGYYYNPHYLMITSWDSREDFEAFRKQDLKMNHKAITHVNQFVLN
jgi:heme-degrading monooxygenase HmoA